MCDKFDSLIHLRPLRLEMRHFPAIRFGKAPRSERPVRVVPFLTHQGHSGNPCGDHVEGWPCRVPWRGAMTAELLNKRKIGGLDIDIKLKPQGPLASAMQD